MDYTHLSLTQIRGELDLIASDVLAGFGPLDSRQLNWKPDAAHWSVGQCLEHLVTANGHMLRAAAAALDPAQARTIWQRLPILPAILGPMLIRSQAPEGTRKFTAPPAARPGTRDVASDVVDRFVEQQRQGARDALQLDERVASATIMVSPFIKVVTYSVLDGWRLVVAHGRRHVAQAQRVMTAPGFPSSR